MGGRVISLKVSGIVILTVLMATTQGCGEPKTSKSGPKPSKSAKAFVAAWHGRDLDALIGMTTESLSEYIAGVRVQRDTLGEMASLLRARFPDDPHETITAQSTHWKDFFLIMRDLELDGRIEKESGPEKQVYQLSSRDFHFHSDKHRLILVRTNDGWKVDNFGPQTPKGIAIGRKRTISRYLVLALPHFKKQLEEAPLRTIRQGSELWERAMGDIIKSYDPRAKSGRGR